jgi:uncharacterized repeat protein (TIGR03803 family)
MTTDGAVTALHGFTGGTDGAYPSPLIQAIDGDLYGTTESGAGGSGTIFRMTLSGNLTILHAFNRPVGANPDAALIQATDGNFYGTTTAGGGSGMGTVFRMTPSGAFNVLHEFAGGSDGAVPFASLIEASDSNFYGTTFAGCVFNLGTVFKMSPGGSVTVLHAFLGSPDGLDPSAALIESTDGNFYGTTFLGGVSGAGTVFQMTRDGTVRILHSFNARDGGLPETALIHATDGSFYGTAHFDSFGFGAVFRIPPTPLVDMSFTADFDGDGKSDLVVYRPSTGEWYVRYSSSGYSYANATSFQWGVAGDIPLVADFDGDGKTDLVVYRPITAVWYVRYSSSHYTSWASFQWGVAGDIPLVADFDGDGKTDLACTGQVRPLGMSGTRRATTRIGPRTNGASRATSRWLPTSTATARPTWS